MVALCTTTIFTSCRNDDDDNGNGRNAATINAISVTGTTTGFATVRAIIWNDDDDETDNYSMVLAEVPFQNGGFTLQLPSPPNNFLRPYFTDGNIPAGFTISDNTVRMIWNIVFKAYNSAGNEIGLLYFADWSWADNNDERPNVANSAHWIYADGDVTITGDSHNSVMRWNLRRGWNIVYWQTTRTTAGYTTAITSQRPTDANLSWRAAR